jgi:hypothetical protein
MDIFFNTRQITYNEAMNYDNFIKFYRFLFKGQFKKMSDSAKILYCALYDRMQLSVKNVAEGNNYWIDKDGYIFIHATIEDIMEIHQCGTEKANNLKKELIKFNLIKDVRIGNNKPNKIYVLTVDYLKSMNNTRTFENRKSGSSETENREVRKSKPNKTNINKTNINKTKNNNNTEIEKISIKEYEIEKISKEIEKELNCPVNLEVLKKAIKKHNLLLDDIRYYLSNWNKFIFKSKDNPVGFLLNLVKTKAEIPKRQQGINKPDQSYNFEQRVYDDDYFDSLYDNFRLD